MHEQRKNNWQQNKTQLQPTPSQNCKQTSRNEQPTNTKGQADPPKQGSYPPWELFPKNFSHPRNKGDTNPYKGANQPTEARLLPFWLLCFGGSCEFLVLNPSLSQFSLSLCLLIAKSREWIESLLRHTSHACNVFLVSEARRAHRVCRAGDSSSFLSQDSNGVHPDELFINGAMPRQQLHEKYPY
mgnify:CR=1 FL=1